MTEEGGGQEPVVKMPSSKPSPYPRSSSPPGGAEDGEEEEFNAYKAYVSFGFFFFVVLNGFIRRYGVPLPDTASRQQRWKWCNILVSFVHSAMTGLCAPLVFYLNPALQEDMVNGYSDFAHMLVGKCCPYTGIGEGVG